MKRDELLDYYNAPKRQGQSLSTHFSCPKQFLGRLHLHFLVERPASGGVLEITDEFSVPAGTDEFVVLPHGWDLLFVDEQTGKPVETPLHGIVVSAVGFFDPGINKGKVHIRVSFQNQNDSQFWTGQVGIEGFFLG